MARINSSVLPDDYIAPGIAEAAELERVQADFAAGFPAPLPS